MQCCVCFLHALTLFLHRFQLHVLGYTVHTVLDNMVDKCEPGALDDCMEEMVNIFIDDIFGTVGEEKDVSACNTSPTKS